MGLKMQNKISSSFSATSMSDLVFLLLIFFMITSTLVSPNAISINLPRSDSSKHLVAKNIEVYIDSLSNYYVNSQGGNREPVPVEEMMPRLLEAAQQYQVTPGDTSTPKLIVLRADAQVPVQAVVTLWDILNQLNEQFEEADRFKLIFATEAKE